MGCEACQVGKQNIDNIFNIDDCTNQDNTNKNYGLLTSNQRDIWLNNLTEPNQPDNNFFNSNQQIVHPCFAQIRKDTIRSFPTIQYFKDNTNLQRFENLLKKFAIYFPKVGYTQGINFLAGYLLLSGFTNQQSLKILFRIVLHKKLLTIGLYQDQFPLNRCYCALFWKLLDKRQPNISSKIKQINVPDQIWIFQWFMTFFLYSFPIYFVKKFFNYIICKKQFAMVCLALGIVNSLKKDINQVNNFDQFAFFEFFDQFKNINICDQKINVDKVINYANSITKYQIKKTLQQLKLQKNIYYTYFRREDSRTQIWKQLTQKLSYERRMFQFDPKSSQYIRDLNSVEHLQRLLLKKSKLYRSKADSKFSSQFHTSNFTIDFDHSHTFFHQTANNNLQPVNNFSSIYDSKYSYQQQQVKNSFLINEKPKQRNTQKSMQQLQNCENCFLLKKIKDEPYRSKQTNPLGLGNHHNN